MSDAARTPRRKSPGRELVETILIALVIALLIRYFVVEVFVVEGRSMVATLYGGERLLVNKFIYRFRPPERGEVIVFRYPRQPDRDFIKRVVALGGDVVEVQQGKVYVNGQLLQEPPGVQPDNKDFPARTVPPGAVWVMGDNRGMSEDSRFFGEVPLEHIKGPAFVRFWPLNRVALIRNERKQPAR